MSDLGKELFERLKRAGDTSPPMLNLAADLVELARRHIEYAEPEDTNLRDATLWLRQKARDDLEHPPGAESPLPEVAVDESLPGDMTICEDLVLRVAGQHKDAP